MIVVLLLFVALLVVVAVYVVRIYNGLVALRENVRKAWSNIDVLLTQRHDELPKLVETCKRYMAYEQETLERVMQARSAVFRAQGTRRRGRPRRGRAAVARGPRAPVRRGRELSGPQGGPGLPAPAEPHHASSRSRSRTVASSTTRRST